LDVAQYIPLTSGINSIIYQVRSWRNYFGCT